MQILAKPVFSNKEKNPYNYLLYSHLVEHGAKVEEFTPSKALFKRYDILHFHWPEVMVSNRSVVLSVLISHAFLGLVIWMKMRGTKFVWTAHDLRSHDFVQKSGIQQKVERWYWDKFDRLLDGVIALSEASLKEVLQYHPVLKNKQHFVIPHGHYKDIYSDTVSLSAAREKLGIGDEELLITYFGQIRPYKNVPKLIESFLDIDNDHYRLLVSGKPKNQELKEEIESLAEAKSDHIKTILKFIPDDEVQYIFRASNLVVIPYKDILNSGSAILSLSFDVPVLVPQKGSIIELEEIFGNRWIKMYQGELTADILDKHAHDVARDEVEKCEKIEEFGWNKIAHQTFQAYQTIAG